MNRRDCLRTAGAGDDPTRLLARSRAPILVPVAECERGGFYGQVVFTNGHVLDGDTVTMYYGAADTVVCGARASRRALVESAKSG